MQETRYGPPLPKPDPRVLRRVTDPPPGRWLKLNYEILRIMSLDEAVLFGFFCHHFDVVEADLPQTAARAGWCWCMAETVEDRLGWDRKKQDRVLAKLKKKGFVDTMQKRRHYRGKQPAGQPVRWVRCRVGAVAVALEEAVTQDYWDEIEADEPGRMEHEMAG
jgi:hypothetical protein